MFLHTHQPSRFLLESGALKIHWYGFLMVAGGLTGFFLVLRLAKFYTIQKKDIWDLAFYWLIFSIIGARIYYVLYAWEFYKNNLIDILKIWQGGLAIHGIMLGGFCAVVIFAWRKNINIWKLLDIAGIGLCAAQIIGRWGNYFNQEIFGKPTTLAWGMPIAPALRPTGYLTADYFHPTVLYESLGSALILAVLLILFFKFVAKRNMPPGLIFASYLILYSILRFCLEFVRIDYSPLVFGIRLAQIVSVVLFIFGIGLLIIRVLLKEFKNQN